ncbi:BZ3500_MvSof-1268-A1-R1_Chr11-3g03526 [Microbotryum saponariae]|uniref:BZ3500_MvSof-1268-A1-R1_Chr11-3g03526 protein n=1 Tax=Microbotryum saponariae TaxID=289078 RepID=A0A2X0KRY2_9BASI|nr:BZ3500_MvSof-1268-A1-R1_Chr11-3g03526 [Microbotryum saponariae]SDA03535.1 BZ3501_MvSof-1269-A2-R1_Chr11g03103 [Microbotryum saponariae]
MLPEGAISSQILPVAFYAHGGAFSVGASSDLAHHQVRYLLSKGFAVLSPEYRLAPHVKQSACREDVLDAFIFYQTKLNDVLAKKVHLEAEIFQPRAAVPAYPACLKDGYQDNPTSALEEKLVKNNSEGWKAVQKLFAGRVWCSFKTNSMPLPDDHPRCIWVNSGVKYNCHDSLLWGNPPYPAAANFLDFFGPWFPPTFMLAAEGDSLIPMQHSYDVVEALKKHGVETRVGIGKNAEHGFTEWNPKLWPEGADWWTPIEEGLNWAIAKTVDAKE